MKAIATLWLALPALLLAQRFDPGISIATPEQATEAEDTLARPPETERLRAALISFYLNRRYRDPAAAAKAAEHTAIQVRLYPWSSVLSDRFGTPEPHPLIEAEWRRHLSAGLTDAAALANAAFYFRIVDPQLADGLIRKALREKPADPFINRLAGRIFALLMTGVKREIGPSPIEYDKARMESPIARAAFESVHDSKNAGMLLGAASYSMGERRGRIAGEAASPEEFALDWLARARELDPANEEIRRNRALAWQLFTSRASPGRNKEESCAKWIEAIRDWLAVADSYSLVRGRSDLTVAHYRCGQFAEADRLAREQIARLDRSDSHADSLHAAHTVSGLVSARSGDLEHAARMLLASVPSSSARLSSFGPNMDLALELLRAGRREPVLTYLHACAKFWEPETIAAWKTEIEAGKIPKFGNLRLR